MFRRRKQCCGFALPPQAVEHFVGATRFAFYYMLVNILKHRKIIDKTSSKMSREVPQDGTSWVAVAKQLRLGRWDVPKEDKHFII